MCDLFLQSYEQYIAPSRKFADIVVPRGSENDVAIDLIVRHVNKQLAKVLIKTIFLRTKIIQLR